MLCFKAFCSAPVIIAGIEIMHMIKKGQLDCSADQTTSASGQLYGLAFRLACHLRWSHLAEAHYYYDRTGFVRLFHGVHLP